MVAALTIPNLNSSTADREKVAKLKKIYAQLNEAFGRAQAVYGSIDEWPFVATDSDDIEESTVKLTNRFVEFMKYQKIEYDDWGLPTVYLADGSSIWFLNLYEGPESSSYENLHFYSQINVDIDGPSKGKNLPGYDEFSFDITENGVLPSATQYEIENNGLSGIYYDDGNDYYYATAWVIQNGNMDYLKTSDGKTCNDSDIVLDWTTNTSCK